MNSVGILESGQQAGEAKIMAISLLLRQTTSSDIHITFPTYAGYNEASNELSESAKR